MAKRRTKRPATPVAYEYGGHIVPGMFKGSDLPKHQDVGIVQPDVNVQSGYVPDSNLIPPVSVEPERRSLFGRIGANIGNIFRSRERDVDPRFKGQLLNPELTNPFRGMDPTQTWGSTTNPQREVPFFGSTTGTQFGSTSEFPILGSTTPSRPFIRKRGGSTGPNGML